jgi:hypothetical protein
MVIHRIAHTFIHSWARRERVRETHGVPPSLVATAAGTAATACVASLSRWRRVTRRSCLPSPCRHRWVRRRSAVRRCRWKRTCRGCGRWGRWLVAPGGGIRWGRSSRGAVGESLGVPAGVVFAVVIASAQRGEILLVGAAAVGPRDHMIDFAGLGAAVAAGEPHRPAAQGSTSTGPGHTRE